MAFPTGIPSSLNFPSLSVVTLLPPDVTATPASTGPEAEVLCSRPETDPVAATGGGAGAGAGATFAISHLSPTFWLCPATILTLTWNGSYPDLEIATVVLPVLIPSSLKLPMLSVDVLLPPAVTIAPESATPEADFSCSLPTTDPLAAAGVGTVAGVGNTFAVSHLSPTFWLCPATMFTLV